MNQNGKRSPSALNGDLSAFHYFTLCFGAVIGVGWIPLVGVWIAKAGPFGAALGFVFGGLLISVILSSYIRMAQRFPMAGGEAVYAWKVYGLKAGFLVGWTLTFSYLAIGTFMAISMGWIISALAPNLIGAELYNVFGVSVNSGPLILGFAASCFLALLHIRGSIWIARFQNILTLALIAASAIFIAVGLVKGDAGNLDPKFVIEIGAMPWAGVASVFAITPLFFGGFNFAVQAIGEKAPKTSVSKIGVALIAAVFCACLFYIAIIMATAKTMPREDLLQSSMPAAVASRSLFGASILADIILVAGLLGIVSSWNAVVLATSRILFFMASVNMIPPFFARKHPKYATPHIAILFTILVSAAASIGGVGLMTPIVGSAGAAITFAYVIVCLSALRLQANAPLEIGNAPHGAIVRIAPFAAGFAFLAAVFEPFFDNPAIHIPTSWLLIGGWSIFGLVLAVAR